MNLFRKILHTGCVTERTESPADASSVPAAGTLRGSVQIRAVDAGSCNGCELEIASAFGPVYDAERFGVRASRAEPPRTASLPTLVTPRYVHSSPVAVRFVRPLHDPRVDNGVTFSQTHPRSRLYASQNERMPSCSSSVVISVSCTSAAAVSRSTDSASA